MPRGDGTGPMGMGPMTGRGAGYCAGSPTPGFMNPMGGRLGLGSGRGRGFRPYSYYGRGRFSALPYSGYSAGYPGYGYSGYGAGYSGYGAGYPGYGAGYPGYGYPPGIW